MNAYALAGYFVWWKTPSASERLAMGVSKNEVGKVAWQADTDTFFVLTNDSPIQWKELGTGSSLGYDLLANLLYPEVSVLSTTALDATSFGRMHSCSGTTANYTITLPAVSGNAGKVVGIRMVSSLTKLVTIAGSGAETLDGLNQRVMWANEVAILLCTGTSWTKIAGKSIPMQGWLYKLADQTIPTSDVVYKILLDKVHIDNTGQMADLANNRIYIRRSGSYFMDTQTWVEVYTYPIARHYSRLLKNGTTYSTVDADKSDFYSISRQPIGPHVLSAGDYLDLYGATSFTSGVHAFTCGNSPVLSHIGLTEMITW